VESYSKIFAICGNELHSGILTLQLYYQPGCVFVLSRPQAAARFGDANSCQEIADTAPKEILIMKAKHVGLVLLLSSALAAGVVAAAPTLPSPAGKPSWPDS
jgi:hypothetical protein